MGRRGWWGAEVGGAQRCVGRRGAWGAEVRGAQRCVGRRGWWGAEVGGAQRLVGRRGWWGAEVRGAQRCVGRRGAWGAEVSIVSIKTERLGNWNIARIDGKRMELRQQLRLQRPDGCCIREGKRWEQRDDMMEVCDWITKHSRHDRDNSATNNHYTLFLPRAKPSFVHWTRPTRFSISHLRMAVWPWRTEVFIGRSTNRCRSQDTVRCKTNVTFL